MHVKMMSARNIHASQARMRLPPSPTFFGRPHLRHHRPQHTSRAGSETLSPRSPDMHGHAWGQRPSLPSSSHGLPYPCHPARDLLLNCPGSPSPTDGILGLVRATYRGHRDGPILTLPYRSAAVALAPIAFGACQRPTVKARQRRAFAWAQARQSEMTASRRRESAARAPETGRRRRCTPRRSTDSLETA